MLTPKMIDNRCAKLKALEAEQQKLAKEADKIKKELQLELEELGAEEVDTGRFTVRWKAIISSRLDSKALKAELPEIYERFTKSSESRRFTIA